MPDAPTPERVGSRRWRWVVRIGALLVIGLVCCLGWLFFDREWTRRDGERHLSDARAQVEQNDPNWTWEKLNAARPKPPEGKNSAALIPQIKKLTAAEWGKELATEEWKTKLDVPPNVRYAPPVVDQVRRELAASTEAVALARTLKDHPFGNREIVLAPNVLDTPLRDTQDTRAVVDLLRWDVVLAVEDGDRRRAADDLLAMLNASRSIGDEPFLISQLVRMATRTVTVQSTEWMLAHVSDAQGLAELQSALAADAEEPLLFYGARGERAAFDRLFENMQAGSASLAQIADTKNPSFWERLGWWHYRANLPADRAFALEWMSQFIEAARRPIHEQPPLVAAIPNPPRDRKHVLSGLLMPAVDKVAHAHWRTTALARCAVVGIACERFRQQHKRWPESLDELVLAFLPAVPLDPYDGRPLRYAKSETGVVVYSVGKRPPNQFGGQATIPVGLPEGIEFGFRLWNPDERRLPPLPDPDPPEREPPP
jgi:hypothetical protein